MWLHDADESITYHPMSYKAVHLRAGKDVLCRTTNHYIVYRMARSAYPSRTVISLANSCG